MQLPAQPLVQLPVQLPVQLHVQLPVQLPVQLLVQLLDREEVGIFHLTNSGYCSWYEFATKIVEYAGLRGVRVRPITTQEFRSMAKLPKFSVLENRRAAEMGLKLAQRWEDGLKQYIASREADSGEVVY